MFERLKDLSIRVKISGFVIPSTIAFGLLMTVLALFFLNDYKNASLTEFKAAVEQIETSAQVGSSVSVKPSGPDSEALLRAFAAKAEQKIRNIGILLIAIVVVVIILATIGAMIISAMIAGPVRQVATGLENISSGDADLTQRLPASANDETGRVSQYFNTFLEKLQGIVGDIQQNGRELSRASEAIHSTIGVIQEKTAATTETSQTLFRSAGYMRSDMKEVASVLDESTENMHMISSAVEQLSSTVSAISETSGRAHDNTEEARKKMAMLETDVEKLGTAGEDISKVTEVIAEISDQVNLLALNATIEAARAGEAGKGFAVVAHEIKELARQTAAAATEIQERIHQVQQVTRTTIDEIVASARIVSSNTDIVATIATAVEEQSATVNEIAASLNSAVEKLDFSNGKVSKASEYADDMATMANSVTESITETDEALITILTTSSTMRELAEKSAQTAGQFRTG